MGGGARWALAGSCLLAWLGGVSGQGFMPVHGSINVMPTAALHSASSVSYDYAARVWSIQLTFDAGVAGVPYAPFLLDQRRDTGPSLNFLSEVAPWCGLVRSYCCFEDLLNGTLYFNDALASAVSGLGACASAPGAWAAALADPSAYGGVRPAGNVTFDFAGNTLRIPHEQAQLYGREYLDQNNNYVVDLRFLAVFQSAAAGVLELAWVPYQAVLLRDIDGLFGRSYEDVRQCVAAPYPSPADSFWLARYASPASADKVCEWRRGWPPARGIAVGYSLWLLMNTTELSRALGADVVPRNLTMESAPTVPAWLDSVAANMSAGIAEQVASIAGRAVGVRALAELHNTQYAREWRVYMHTLRAVYERLNPGSAVAGLETVFLRESASQPYAFPPWLQQMGVFDREGTVAVADYPVARRSGPRVGLQRRGGRRQALPAAPIDAVAMEMVVFLDTQGLTVGEVVNSIFQAGVAMVNSTSLRGLWGMDIFVRELTVRVEPVGSRFQGGFLVSFLLLGAAGAALACLGCYALSVPPYERLRRAPGSYADAG
ncbi:hypothetical protein GUITHDRAFT_144197 [Guillardia theta CCMP2712]|uniref:Uncharacterized protein n=1 Tax=Guillardia theta (strain CCMP2712) TaxID=905079 RepID=L1IQS5_GUITC|nr:hypothetical protein GUITHDRAFT_144197 [Guillardia theta CCMP2712]EKX38608.1 hypothetical protein GUITHDRAFT_144197 [Guillardia theta CCMP2712]|eukprot:XP_005825588.1 hypothetical protein GUITHDRAFT_144197 [Guillardia theta CCMP2712]